MSLIPIRYYYLSKISKTFNLPPAALVAESLYMQDQIKKHSTLFNNSSNDENEQERNLANEALTLKPAPFTAFFLFYMLSLDKFKDKDAEYRANKLKLFREDCSIQIMAKTAFDFNLDDKTRLENHFVPEGYLKKM